MAGHPKSESTGGFLNSSVAPCTRLVLWEEEPELPLVPELDAGGVLDLGDALGGHSQMTSVERGRE